MSADSEDLVLWILRELVGAIPGYAASKSNAIVEIEMQAPRHWGGRRPYIAKTRQDARKPRG